MPEGQPTKNFTLTLQAGRDAYRTGTAFNEVASNPWKQGWHEEAELAARAAMVGDEVDHRDNASLNAKAIVRKIIGQIGGDADALLAFEDLDAAANVLANSIAARAVGEDMEDDPRPLADFLEDFGRTPLTAALPGGGSKRRSEIMDVGGVRIVKNPTLPPDIAIIGQGDRVFALIQDRGGEFIVQQIPGEIGHLFMFQP